MLIGMLFTVAASPPAAAEGTNQTLTVFKSATCACCKKWVTHLEKNGFKIESYDMGDMPSVKDYFEVRAGHQSCHTAQVGGYYIEGHVPAEDIQRLLRENPDIRGLTVPGMPIGSPGMEQGDRLDPYDVLAVDKEGKVTVFSKHNQK